MTAEGAAEPVPPEPAAPEPAALEPLAAEPAAPLPPTIIHPTVDATAVTSRRTTVRAILTLALFALSVALGAALQVGAKPPEQQIQRFPTIVGGAAEPTVTADIARAVVAKDPQALAKAYSADLLQAYQGAMAPVVDADDIHYVGGVEKEGETLASYVVTGQASDGSALISGFVVHVKDGQITGFN